jgi:hypothetical protein
LRWSCSQGWHDGPYYPFWSLLIITLDVFVIWAIAAHGGSMRDARP